MPISKGLSPRNWATKLVCVAPLHIGQAVSQTTAFDNEDSVFLPSLSCLSISIISRGPTFRLGVTLKGKSRPGWIGFSATYCSPAHCRPEFDGLDAAFGFAYTAAKSKGLFSFGSYQPRSTAYFMISSEARKRFVSERSTRRI